MAEHGTAGAADDDEAFERELEAVLALDPVERLNRYSQMEKQLAEELNEADTEN